MTFDNLCQQIFGKIRKIKIDVPQTITRYKNTIKTITVFVIIQKQTFHGMTTLFNVINIFAVAF